MNVTGSAGVDRERRVFYGWYVLAASFLILFVNAAGQSIIGVMVKPMTDDFGWSRGAVSSAVFLNLAVYALATLVTGRLYDRFGPKWVIAACTVLVGLGYGLMTIMGSLWEFLLYYGVLAAAGFGGTSIPLFGSLLGNWFEKWRGMAISLAIAGFCLGQFFLIPLFSDRVIISGWRTTSLWIAGVTVAVSLPLVLGVLRGNPSKFGLRPYGRGAGVLTGAATAAPAGAPAAGAVTAGMMKAPAPAVPRVSRDLTLGEAMRTRSLWLIALIWFICGGGDYLVITHLVPMVTDFGLSEAVGAGMLAWLGLLGLGGLLLAGPAADAIGGKAPIALTFLLRTALFAVLMGVKGSVPFWVFALAMGFTLPITAPLLPHLVGKLYGLTHLGFICGFVSTVHMLGGGLWGYLGGAVFDSTGNYDLALLISAVLAAVAVVSALLIREERHTPESWTRAHPRAK